MFENTVHANKNSHTGIRWYDKNVDKGGGGAIDLVMYLFGMSFREAVELLQKREKAGRLEVERGK